MTSIVLSDFIKVLQSYIPMVAAILWIQKGINSVAIRFHILMRITSKSFSMRKVKKARQDSSLIINEYKAIEGK